MPLLGGWGLISHCRAGSVTLRAGSDFSHGTWEAESRAGVLSHQAFAAHSPHSAESPTVPTAGMDLLPAAPRATTPVASAAAALGPPGE